MMKPEAALFLATNDKFTIDQCEQLAKDLGKFDSMTFDLVGPTGRKSAKWLDAYYGFMQIEGLSGFVTSADFRYVPDVHCENLAWPDMQGNAA